MSNIKSLFRSQPIFWFKNRKDKNASTDGKGGELGDMLDKWSNLRGVTCDGKVAGLTISGVTGNVTMSLEVIEGTKYIVIRSCNGTEVARFAEV